MSMVSQHNAHPLRLAAHVQACRSEDQVILLDLRRNRYLGVGGTHVQALAGAVEGWPCSPLMNGAAVSPAQLSVLTKRLVLQGLLTRNPLVRARLPQARLADSTSSLCNQEVAQGWAVGPRRLFWFVQSAAAAALALRCRSLWTVVRTVALRRARSAPNDKSPALDEIRTTVAVYEKLRPLVFTSRDKCLFDSLALVNFLAHERIFARWVIGVKTNPFGAHSWVQSGDVVLNDMHEHVRQFTPILVV